MTSSGYIQIEFDGKFKNSLLKWSKKSINPKYLVYSKIDGKIIGGLEAQNAHLMLSYGIPKDTEYTEEILREIQGTRLPKIFISGLKYFYEKQYNAKILYLSVEDKKQVLDKIHNKFSKFVSRELQNKFPFIPHITIAYVSENFNEKAVNYDGLREPKVSGIKYYKS